MFIRRKKYLVILALILSSAFLFYQHITINITPSMKKGLYWKANGKINRGDTVLFCLEEKQQQFGLSRHYLEQGLFNCSASPLIKKVVAVPGDDVVLTDHFLIVNGLRYKYKTLARDSNNRPLPIYPRGHYHHTVGYWLIGFNAINSWDSRYWGPIKHQQIISRLEPILLMK